MEEMAPELVQLYTLLGSYTAPIAREKGTIDENTMKAFEQIFSQELAFSTSNRQGGR
jgi:hypothetical protein